MISVDFQREYARENGAYYSVVFYYFLSALVYGDFKAFTNERAYRGFSFVHCHNGFFHIVIIAFYVNLKRLVIILILKNRYRMRVESCP